MSDCVDTSLLRGVNALTAAMTVGKIGMNDKRAADVLKVTMEKRGLNEFGSKILKEERLDMVVRSRQNERLADHSDMTFRCECDDPVCLKTIMMSTEEYQKVHQKTKHFTVVPEHVRADLEEVVSAFNNYVLVAKFFPRTQAG